MTKRIIGAVIAGILIMAWQTLSHTALQLHTSQEQYTPNQDAILKVLSENLNKKGQYFLPNVPPGTSMEEMEKVMATHMGKPQASILYNPVMDYNMGANIGKGLATNILLGVILVWLLGKLKVQTFVNIFATCVSLAFIMFCFYPYPGYIWYKTEGIEIELLDGLMAFGLAGAWLGWWMPRKAKR
jgi:hypothetical protein